MSGQDKGMRKGISLVEMLIAIVLFGLISVISYNYYKVYYDTSFAAKQARMYAILDQAQQLSNSHQIYETKNGVEPDDISDMVSDRQLLEEPPVPNLVSNSGWEMRNVNSADGTIDLDLGTGTTVDNDVAFVITVDGQTDGGDAVADKDRLDYCNIMNNLGKSSWSLSALDVAVPGTGPTDGIADVGTGLTMFCYNTQAAATTPAIYEMVFVKRIDPN